MRIIIVPFFCHYFPFICHDSPVLFADFWTNCFIIFLGKTESRNAAAMTMPTILLLQGKLKYTDLHIRKPLLPPLEANHAAEMCRISTPNLHCFHAGDGRWVPCIV